MKNIFTKALLLAGASIALASLFTACEDEPDRFRLADGKPTVYYVRPVDVAAADSLLDGAYMGNSICIVGENLRSVYQLDFNDVTAVLNNSYITDNTILLDVPKTIPTEVSNAMYLITKGRDTVKYDFKVLVPGPSIISMSNEYAPKGSTATIYGDYFVDDPNVPLELFVGDVKANIKDFSKGSISFVVPDEAVVNDRIKVKTIYGEVTSAFQWCDTRGLLFDFDGATGLGNHGWHAQTIESDETSLTGNFLRLGAADVTMDEDGGWNDGHFSFEYWCGSWDTPQNITSGDGIALYNLVDFTDFADMSLKFELYVPTSNPWQSGAMQICFEGVDKVTLSGNPIDGEEVVAGANAYVFNNQQNDLGKWGRALYRPWTAAQAFDTGDQWITVSVPISSFIYDKDGSMTDVLPSSPKDFASLTIFVLGGGIKGVECNPVLKIDNIRAVPNK